jgi:dolichol-phosphate mannosyltransferase
MIRPCPRRNNSSERLSLEALRPVSRGAVSLGIVCPAANEALTAVRLVRDVLHECRELREAVFYAVLDRVSRDGTRGLLEEYASREPRLRVVWAPENRCVVDAYFRGYHEALAADHDFILEMDAGYSHLPSDIPKFLAAMEAGYDCVFGSRFMAGGRVEDSSILRRILSQGGTVLTNLLAGTRLKDMTSGFELFSRSGLQYVLEQGVNSRAHFFQTEIKFHCRCLNIVEVPITYRAASPSVGTASIADAFRNLARLRRLRREGQ